MTTTKIYGHHILSFYVDSAGYHTFTVPGFYTGIESADARIVRYMTPPHNRVDITFRVGEATSKLKTLTICVNPNTSPDKEKWVHLTPIHVGGCKGLVPVYATLTED